MIRSFLPRKTSSCSLNSIQSHRNVVSGAQQTFLQSKDWAKFQQAFGRKIFWLDDKLVVKFDLPLGKSWLYCARAELRTKNQELRTFFNKLAKIAREENGIFCKIEPNLTKSTNNQDTITKQIQNSNVQNPKLSSIVYRLSSNLQPQDELLLDITPSKEKILAQMHPKTRYNIRLAEKHGLKIQISTDPKDVNDFYNLAIKTSQKKGFSYHNKRYYEKMLEILNNGKEIQVRLLTAYHQNKPVSSLILLIYHDQAYYLHGASDDNYRHLMSTYFLQWRAIQRAKKQGCKWYNLGGIAPQEQTGEQKNIRTKKHKNEFFSPSVFPFFSPRPQWASWSGITRFKMGFCQEPTEQNFLHYPSCYDIVYQLGMYRIYKLYKSFK